MKIMPNIFDCKLESIMINNRFIAKKLEGNNLRLFHKYWIPSFNTYVKVYDISILNDCVYYYIKYDRMEGVISEPLEKGIYELYTSSNIENECIINSSRDYTGAEIKYWFVLNRDKLSEEVYDSFYKYLIYDKYNNMEISDTEYYNIVRYKNKSKILLSRKIS
jgi:hypothetical protein